MAPRDSSVDLQAQIQSIAMAAKERNPDGFKLAPVETLQAQSEAQNQAPREFVNVFSGQQVILLDNARNVPQFLQAMR